jgi:NAD(P)H-hydrate epimerase
MEHLPEALYRAAEVREADRRAMHAPGLGGAVLMERAGAAAFDLMRERYPRARRVAVVCGPGNNGGDGYVLARLAQAAGLMVRVLSPQDPATLKGDARTAWQAWVQAGGVTAGFDPARLADAELVVDALFGTGLERPLEGVWREAVAAIGAARRPVVALDIPSGLHADSGRAPGVAVRADVTVCFIGLKAGMFTARGREHCGLILFSDLAVPAEVFDGLQPLARRITANNLAGLLPPRPQHAHKGVAGRVLVIGGQSGMPGAARLAGEAAYRAGAGLVTLATHPGHAGAIASACPELIAHGISANDELGTLMQAASAVALGPGLGQDEWSRMLWAAALAAERPLVVDADALNLLAAQPRRRPDWILTPHPGEAARLLGVTVPEIESDRFAAARAIVQRYGGVCVLKGSGTLVAHAVDEPLWLCDRGNPGMATAGTGDVLSGVIAALCAQRLALPDAARAGVWLHAMAGDRATAAGARGLRASDLLLPLHELVSKLADADRAPR